MDIVKSGKPREDLRVWKKRLGFNLVAKRRWFRLIKLFLAFWILDFSFFLSLWLKTGEGMISFHRWFYLIVCSKPERSFGDLYNPAKAPLAHFFCCPWKRFYTGH